MWKFSLCWLIELYKEVSYRAIPWGQKQVGLRITHLLIANATFFCRASNEEVLYLSWMLLVSEAASGLKVNLEKSFVYLVGQVGNAKILASELGCNDGMLPSFLLSRLARGECSVFGKVWKKNLEEACWPRSDNICVKEAHLL